jgi:hypothetical protein
MPRASLHKYPIRGIEFVGAGAHLWKEFMFLIIIQLNKTNTYEKNVLYQRANGWSIMCLPVGSLQPGLPACTRRCGCKQQWNGHKRGRQTWRKP